MHIFIFLDDGLGACESEEETIFFSQMVRSDLKSAGICEQTPKCNWGPRKELIWLGILISLIRRLLIIPEHKGTKLERMSSRC